MENKKIIEYAKKTFLAQQNPYNTIEKVYPLAINKLQEETFIGYVGIKNNNSIGSGVMEKLNKKGYFLHTLDKMSLGGRAIDVSLKNPLTGRCMTGSSSGTSLNVFYGINDLGVGSDGGGSVLNPALSLNLFGIISKSFEREYTAKFSKKSTDGIEFSPSIGFIARDLSTIKKASECYFDINLNLNETIRVGVPRKKLIFSNIDVSKEIDDMLEKSDARIEKIYLDYPDLLGDRRELISFMKSALENCDVLVSPEGSIDCYGFGDTVFGGYDDVTAEIQRSGNKALSKVANMVGATALIMPQQRLAFGYLLSTADGNDNSKLFKLAECFNKKRNSLTESYFLNLDNYFAKGYNE